MWNPAHLAILKKGVGAWNKWREDTPDDVPDLSTARLFGEDLRGMNLSGANLNNANFGRANLSGANLSGANLSNANLSRANLSKADLTEANLNNANLGKANLSEANLDKANLHKAKLYQAKLRGTTLSHADLNNANLNKASLNGADLSKANLIDAQLRNARLNNAKLVGANLDFANLNKANLFEAELRNASFDNANLSGVNLSKADLSGVYFEEANLKGARLFRACLFSARLAGADLSKADLKKADLRKADLTGAKLVNTNLEDANLRYAGLIEGNLAGGNLSGTQLYGTARDDWNVKGVKCKYVYWDAEGKQRSPKDRDFEPREFEQLYASLTKIEYVFKQGMTPLDPLLMDFVAQEIRAQVPESGIALRSIDRGGPWPVALFVVSPRFRRSIKEIHDRIAAAYEEKIHMLETDKRQLLKILYDALTQPRIQLTAGRDILTGHSSVTNVEVEQAEIAIGDIMKAVKDEPEESFVGKTKAIVLDLLGDAAKDVAKGRIKEAVKALGGLAVDLAPVMGRIGAEWARLHFLGGY